MALWVGGLVCEPLSGCCNVGRNRRDVLAFAFVRSVESRPEFMMAAAAEAKEGKKERTNEA